MSETNKTLNQETSETLYCVYPRNFTIKFRQRTFFGVIVTTRARSATGCYIFSLFVCPNCSLVTTRSELSGARVAFLLLVQNCQTGGMPLAFLHKKTFLYWINWIVLEDKTIVQSIFCSMLIKI